MIALANPEPNSVYHCLDDVVFVTTTREANKVLVDTYKELSCKINISLASESNPNKAFSFATKGKVLGVTFDTVLQTWSLDQDKVNDFSC